MLSGLSDIRTFPLEELLAFFKQHGQDTYRAKQVYEWLWKKGVQSFDEMSSLPKTIRLLLQEHFTLNPLIVSDVRESHDGTKKFALSLHDERVIETVLIPSENRVTACISTQAGCALRCGFCATGMMGYSRNLESWEIYGQAFFAHKEAMRINGNGLSNIVYMGMGEPLLNYENTVKSVEMISGNDGLSMSPQRITISTVGIAPAIMRLADDGVKAQLAVSLHSAVQGKRASMMPVAKTYSLDELSKAISYYHKKTGNRITIEYILFRDLNDGPGDAEELAIFCRSFPVKVNLIEYNNTGSEKYKKTETKKLSTFKHFLESKNMIVNIRNSRGGDINAACGQLASLNNNQNNTQK
ncbi:MAG: 23S rRNA (adenine(2503)-C(2))-methyltransferase RlmN [Bacteroidota bacterium]